MVLRMTASTRAFSAPRSGRRGGRTAGGRAIDQVLGELDVLHQLDVGIEVEGRRHQPVEGERLGVARRRGRDRTGARIPPARHWSCPRPSPTAPSARLSRIRSSTPQKTAKRSPKALKRSVTRRMSPVSSLIATIAGHAGEPFQGRDVHVDPVGDRVVVDHHRQALAGDRLVPGDGLARGRCGRRGSGRPSAPRPRAGA